MTFEDAYESYYKCIYTYVYRMVGNRDETEDIVQETFMKLYNHLSSHPPLESTKTWLYRTASNTFINVIRRQKIFQKVLTLNNPGEHHKHRNPTEEDLIKEQEQALVRDAMEKLPARDRAILALYGDKFSYSDMAAILKIKTASVGKILSRAREKLAKEIRKGGQQ
jgi:RNA polymerase sigma-70 factor (ECF subfamily)